MAASSSEQRVVDAGSDSLKEGRAGNERIGQTEQSGATAGAALNQFYISNVETIPFAHLPDLTADLHLGEPQEHGEGFRAIYAEGPESDLQKLRHPAPSGLDEDARMTNTYRRSTAIAHPAVVIREAGIPVAQSRRGVLSTTLKSRRRKKNWTGIYAASRWPFVEPSCACDRCR